MGYRKFLEDDDMKYKCTIVMPSCCDCSKRKFICCNEYEWINVFDGVEYADKKLMQENVEDIRFIYLNKNHGAGYARNVGLDAARGEYIYFQDSDDEFIGFDVLNKLYDEAKAHDADICGGSFAIIREDGEVWTDDKIDNGYSFSEDGWVNFEEYQFDYGFMRFIYKTSFLKENHIFFPEYRRYQDPPFMVEAFQKAGRFYAIKDITYRINAHEKVNWSDSELDGLEAGLSENISRSLEYDYPELGRNNIRRIFSDFGKLWSQYNRTDSVLIKQMYRNNLLQSILFPQSDFNLAFSDHNYDLYYRTFDNGSNPVFLNNNYFIVCSDNLISFNTYLNSFSCKKWNMYSDVRSVGLVLDMKGRATVSLFYDHIMDGQVYRDQLSSNYVDASERRYLYFDFKDIQNDGAFSFDIQSHSEVLIYGGFYIDNYPNKERDVSIAVAITNYHKEPYLRNNLRRIEDLNDDRIHVYVADNGNSVENLMFSNTYLFKNHNTGGAGGFARCILEIDKDKEKYKYTDFVLMDDDVSLDSRVLLRLINFISHICPEYRNSMIGGAMLRSDMPWFHVESGAKWKGLTVEPLGYGLDMRKPEDIQKVDALKGADYNAWWFCCIPIKYIREDNLPLPLFFQWDDVDYGLRNKAPVITMSGIAVRHDPFDLKRTAMQSYYSNRNSLIVNSCHDGGDNKKSVLKTLKKRICSEVCLYRYEYADALNRAIEDYLKGPIWLCTIDPEELNEEILRFNKPLSDVSAQVDLDWYRVGCGIKDCDLLHTIIRILTLNGYLLRAKKELTLPIYADRPVQGYRAKKILFYEENSGMGFTREKNNKKALSCMLKFQKLYICMIFKYSRMVKSYRDKYSYMTSKEMWLKYLKIEEEC